VSSYRFDQVVRVIALLRIGAPWSVVRLWSAAVDDADLRKLILSIPDVLPKWLTEAP
jgi:hypothetical protein